jgi:hypothetical protein
MSLSRLLERLIEGAGLQPGLLPLDVDSAEDIADEWGFLGRYGHARGGTALADDAVQGALQS